MADGATKPAEATSHSGVLAAQSLNGTPPEEVTERAVTTALAAGWMLATLLPLLGAPNPRPDDPETSLLLGTPPPGMIARELQTKVTKLRPYLQAAGGATASSAVIKRLVKAADGGEPDAEDVMAVVCTLSDVLSVASTRLGKAFGLGFDLANTCRLPANATQAEFEQRFGARVIGIQQALADLSSSLPAHAGRAVSLSFALWQAWAEKQQLSNRPVQWPHDGVQDALNRQGEVWRSVLTGEKQADDMLGVDDYLQAVRTLAARVLASRRWVVLLLAITIIAIGAGVYLIVAKPGLPSKIGGVLLSIVGALGITTASLKRAFSSVTSDLEHQLWGAELDAAIAEAIVVAPGDWQMKLKKIDLPPRRGSDPGIASNARIVHEVATAISARRRPQWLRQRSIDDHLHELFKYRPIGGPTIAEEPARRRLLASAYLGMDPTQLRAGAPGRLASEHQNGGDIRAAVWTFHQGKLFRLEEAQDYAEAREAVLTPWLGSASGVHQALQPDDGAGF